MLTNLQRKRICEASDSLNIDQESLAVWAKKEFKLKKAPTQSTISFTLKKRKSYDEMELTELAAKRPRRLKHPQLDWAIAKWVSECEARSVHLSYDIIKCKARALAILLNIEDPPKFSNGWMHKFTIRHGFMKYRCHGESGSVNMEIVRASLPMLQLKIAQYAPCDVYNMDETGLFYSKAPCTTISRNPIEGVKQDKRRLTVALSANADGSDKLSLLFIGKSKSPRCFPKKSAATLGFCYEYNPKAWMTTGVFTAWITDLNQKMKKRNRNILMLLDNAPTHKKIQLSNIELLFLPPNTTSKLQPMDAGIISAFKKLYKQRFWHHAIELAERKQPEIYKVDQLLAMEWCTQSWKELTTETIENCFGHTNLLAVGKQKVLRNTQINLSIEADLCSCLKALDLTSDAMLDDDMETQDVHEPSPDAELLLQPREKPQIKIECRSVNQTLLTKFFK